MQRPWEMDVQDPLRLHRERDSEAPRDGVGEDEVERDGVPAHPGLHDASCSAYDARFRRARAAAGNLAPRRAGGIASTGTVVFRTTSSVVDPNTNRDARPMPRYPITIKSQP